MILDLLDLCEPTAKEIGECRGLEVARELVLGVTGYQRQRLANAQAHSARKVVEQLHTMVAANNEN